MRRGEREWRGEEEEEQDEEKRRGRTGQELRKRTCPSKCEREKSMN